MRLDLPSRMRTSSRTSSPCAESNGRLYFTRLTHQPKLDRVLKYGSANCFITPRSMAFIRPY
jgi:hypothetical protein